jgi:hypothetical protein
MAEALLKSPTTLHIGDFFKAHTRLPQQHFTSDIFSI